MIDENKIESATQGYCDATYGTLNEHPLIAEAFKQGANYIFKFVSPNEAKEVRDILNKHGVCTDPDVHKGELIMYGIDDYDIEVAGTIKDLTICF